MSSDILIPYFSGNGHCRRIAQAIAKGATDATMIDTAAPGDHRAALRAARAIVFGAPTYMGGVPAAYQVWLEQASSDWPEAGWDDKIAAGFTTACHPSGDKLAVLQRFSIFAAQMGMIWVGQTSLGAPVMPDRPGVNRDGAWLGLMATDAGDTVSDADIQTAELFGARIRAAVNRWG